MMSHPGQPIPLYDVIEVTDHFTKHPLQNDIIFSVFGEDGSLIWCVTDRPIHSAEISKADVHTTLNKPSEF